MKGKRMEKKSERNVYEKKRKKGIEVKISEEINKENNNEMEDEGKRMERGNEINKEEE